MSNKNTIAKILGWQAAFYIPGIFSIIIGLFWFIYVPQKHIAETLDIEKFNIFFDRGVKWVSIFKLVAIFSLIIGFIFNAAIVSLPQLLTEQLDAIGENPTSVSFFAFGIYIVAGVAQLTVGQLIDQIQIKPIFLSISIFLIIALILVIFTNNFLLIAAATSMMALVYATLPISDTILARSIPPNLRSRAYALIYLISFSASASAVPVISILHSRDGFKTLYVLLIVLASVLVLTIIKLPRHKN